MTVLLLPTQHFTESFQGEVDFFAFVDERATQFATTIQSVAFGCPTTVRANFYINYYFDPQVRMTVGIRAGQAVRSPRSSPFCGVDNTAATKT